MRSASSVRKASTLLVAGMLGLFCATADDRDWPQWRGPSGNGVAPSGNPPITWSDEENIKWTAAVPGIGHATPIVWGNRIILLSAGEAAIMDPDAEQLEVPSFFRNRYDADKDGELDADETAAALRGLARFARRRTELSVEPVPDKRHSFAIYCLDRRTGVIMWSRIAKTAYPKEGKHGSNSYGSASPVTDGERIVADFGSHGTFCYDYYGELLWERDLGQMNVRSGFGEAASPAIHGDTVVFVRDQEMGSFIVALDIASGEERWRRERNEPTNWSSPLIVDRGDVVEVVANGTNAVRGYNLETGEELWTSAGHSGDVVPTPTSDGSVVYVMAGNLDSSAYAIGLGYRGDLSGTEAVRWSLDRGTPYVSSPLLHDRHLYFVHHTDAVLSCINAEDGGQLYWRQKLGEIDSVLASPVAVGDHIYIPGNNGTTAVVTAGPEFRILALNTLDNKFRASPVVMGDELLLRGDDLLYCIAENR